MCAAWPARLCHGAARTAAAAAAMLVTSGYYNSTYSYTQLPVHSICSACSPMPDAPSATIATFHNWSL